MIESQSPKGYLHMIQTLCIMSAYYCPYVECWNSNKEAEPKIL